MVRIPPAPIALAGLVLAVVAADTVAQSRTRAVLLHAQVTGLDGRPIAGAGLAFVGDTLFAMGCGRLFEGTAEQMWSSLQKIMRWPDDTKLYCAHEYTQANARFALSVEPGNEALRARSENVDRLRAQGEPTVPTTVGLEKATNPFLRPNSPGLRSTLGLPAANLVEVFARTRKLKDSFRG